MKTTLIALCLLAAPRLAADAAGSWNIEGTLGGKPLSVVCSLQHKGTTLAGTCSSASYNAEATGAAEGDNITFTYKYNSNGSIVTLVFVGVVETPTLMTGTVSGTGLKASPFKALRR